VFALLLAELSVHVKNLLCQPILLAALFRYTTKGDTALGHFTIAMVKVRGISTGW
jgi:hypothetical protein